MELREQIRKEWVEKQEKIKSMLLSCVTMTINCDYSDYNDCDYNYDS